MHISFEPEIGFFNDGDQLPEGKVISMKRGFPVVVYRCDCGREQTAKCAGFTGGISEDDAQSVGWEHASPRLGAHSAWVCPFCSGNTEKLFQVFAAPSST